MVKPQNTLANVWTLWYELKSETDAIKSGVYVDKLNEVCSMDSVESFHQYYSYLKAPAQLPMHSTLYIFRDHMRPLWESFPEGGSWTYRLKRDSSKVNKVWENLVLSCVGEGIGSPNVAGITLGSRAKEFVISIWLSSGQTSELRFQILEKLREILQFERNDTIQFKDFHSAILDDSSRVNAVTYRVKPADAYQKRSVVDPKKKFILPDPVSGSFTFNY